MMKSKYIILAIILVSVLSPCHAAPIGKERALSIAGRFLRSGGSKTLDKQLIVTNESPDTKAHTDIPFFIIKDPTGGFVIVSNETATVPILAYSFTETFALDGAPESLKSWMTALSEGVADIKKRNLSQSSVIKKKWEQALGKTKAEVNNEGQILLETAQWNQWAPYNDQCPEINGKKAPTGCLPTAMAIIMQYWKCPETATSAYIQPYTYYCNDSKYENGGWVIDYNYDWNNMPMITEQYKTTEQIKAISTLMRDCGAVVRAEYSEDATGAAMIDAAALKHQLGFDKSAQYIQWNLMSNELWQQTLTNEIKEGRPILFAGYDYYYGGHAFVGDGIDAEGNMRMNWGWGGVSNGFYSLAPFEYENEKRNPAYFFTLCAWIGLEPDKNSLNEPIPRIMYMQAQENEIVQNKPFHISFSQESAEKGHIDYFEKRILILSVSDKNGLLKEFISKEITGGKTNILQECIITKPIETGDYIEVRYKYHYDDDWRAAWHDYEQCEGIILLKDEVSLQDFTQILIEREVAPRKHGTLSEDSTIMLISTKRGTHITLYNEKGEGISNGGESSYIDGQIPINQLSVWMGDMDIANRMIIHIYLSNLSKGKYTIKLKRHLESTEFSFEQ